MSFNILYISGFIFIDLYFKFSTSYVKLFYQYKKLSVFSYNTVASRPEYQASKKLKRNIIPPWMLYIP